MIIYSSVREKYQKLTKKLIEHQYWLNRNHLLPLLGIFIPTWNSKRGENSKAERFGRSLNSQYINWKVNWRVQVKSLGFPRASDGTDPVLLFNYPVPRTRPMSFLTHLSNTENNTKKLKKYIFGVQKQTSSVSGTFIEDMPKWWWAHNFKCWKRLSQPKCWSPDFHIPK